MENVIPDIATTITSLHSGMATKIDTVHRAVTERIAQLHGAVACSQQETRVVILKWIDSREANFYNVTVLFGLLRVHWERAYLFSNKFNAALSRYEVADCTLHRTNGFYFIDPVTLPNNQFAGSGSSVLRQQSLQSAQLFRPRPIRLLNWQSAVFLDME
ncbi:hypothetical protein V1522DRAFT_395331 [Lipomyces starkeyi]